MSGRVKFIASYLEGEDMFTALCDRYRISRKTGYKWVKRYNEGGIEAIREYSRAPHSHPNATPDDVVEKILKARRKPPLWGPKKLLIVLRRQHPDIDFPSKSTTGEILRRNGMIKTRRRRRRSAPHKEPLRTYDYPNAVWCADFKGDFPVGGKRCCPLTISDGYSRYLLGCKALKSSTTTPSRKVFELAFREFGLPEVIRTDNGAPFSSVAPAGLSRLSVWWIRLGIVPERIMPARPDQNGRHERMHRTLKAATARPPRSSFRAQQRAFDAFRHEYNEIRPHEALDQKVPADLYQPSERPYPRKLPEPVYPEGFEIQKVYPNGVVSIARTQWYVSSALRGEWIGLKPLPGDRWKVYFAYIPLGIADLNNARRKKSRNFAHLVPTDEEAAGWHGRRKPPGRKRAKV
jgi:transposase InsO family protein